MEVKILEIIKNTVGHVIYVTGVVDGRPFVASNGYRGIKTMNKKHGLHALSPKEKIAVKNFLRNKIA